MTDPIRQERVISEFFAMQSVVKRRKAQLQNARFGPPWVYVCLAGLTWGFVAAGWLVDFTKFGGMLTFGAFPFAMFLLGVPLFRGITRCREELLLSIIEEEAPAAYQWLKKEKFMPNQSGYRQPPGLRPSGV